MNRMIFGLGTGRCGTDSLTALLNEQPATCARHESIVSPWVPDANKMKSMLDIMHKYPEEVAAEIAFYYLPYVPFLMGTYPDTKFICLKRDKEATIASYDRQTSFNPKNGLAERNHWTARNSNHWSDKWRLDPIWDPCYPKYDLPRLESIAQYWEDYYIQAEKYVEKYPSNFIIIKMEKILNNGGIQYEVLKFLGYEQPNIVVGIKKNAIRS